jgi:hypothetical protein
MCTVKWGVSLPARDWYRCGHQSRFEVEPEPSAEENHTYTRFLRANSERESKRDMWRHRGGLAA